MTDTKDLIGVLVANAAPVRRLRAPWLRAGAWLALAGSIYAVLATGYGLRPDWAGRIADRGFILVIGSSLATGVLAAMAAFLLAVPDRSRGWVLLPLPALAVWMSTLTYGCLTQWVNIGPDGIRFGEAARCFATVLATGVPLSVALVLMLRHARWFRPVSVTVAGALSVAALAATAVSLFHSVDATIMVILWNFGLAAAFVGAGSIAGLRAVALPRPR